MEIKIGNRQILQMLYILSWIIFVGICIDAGGIIFNAFYVLFNADVTWLLWGKAHLSDLYRSDPGYFFAEVFLMSMVAIAKALLFYLIVKILYDKKLNMSQPFSKEMGSFIFKASYLSLLTGLLSFWGVGYREWFFSRGVNMPDIRDLGFGGADVWIFMSVVLFVIAHIFKRGIEIQNENDLTI